MDNCCCVELKVTEDPIIALDIKEQFISGGEITPTGTKEISVTQNGTTTTDVTYYANAKVVANVPNTYAAADEGKVVQDGDLEAQTTATFEANDVYDTTTIKQVTVDVPASAVDSGYVYITENGTEDVVGYAQAVVNVPNTYAAGDEGKVVDNGALVAQGSATYTVNNTYDTTKIKSVTVNVSGGGSPTLQTKSVSYTPSESQQTAQVTADEGYDALQEVDVTVGAISSTYVGSGIDRNDSTDLTASGATVTAPAGYYAESASKAVAAGTAGTPVATKGTVSNHSIDVTPSVTNSAGYVASETKTGTAVTVSASELVSGTKPITANGTNIDVTGYAAVDVNVSGGGGGGLTTIASGTFTGTGDVQIPINVGKKMPQTDFWVKFKAQSNTEFPYNASYKPAYVYAILNSDMGHFNLSTVGNEKQVVSDLSYDVNNGGTISHVSAGAYIADLDYIRETSSGHQRPNNFLISRKSDHFEVILMHSNNLFAYPPGITYDWEVVYFGSNAATDIIEIP